MGSAAHQLEVVHRTVDGVAVVSVRGEVDLGTKHVLEQELEPVREAAGPVVLDLAGVPFMDSSGLHVVVSLWRSLAGDGRALAVACGGAGLRQLFGLMGLDGRLAVYDDLNAALRAFGATEFGPAEPGVSAPGS